MSLHPRYSVKCTLSGLFDAWEQLLRFIIREQQGYTPNDPYSLSKGHDYHVEYATCIMECSQEVSLQSWDYVRTTSVTQPKSQDKR